MKHFYKVLNPQEIMLVTYVQEDLLKIAYNCNLERKLPQFMWIFCRKKTLEKCITNQVK